VIKIENGIATIDVEGVRKETSIILLEDVKVGEYVIVHAGFAINKLDEVSAKESLNLLRAALNASDEDM
jgi:hydrogenase expression/formation protein HypC